MADYTIGLNAISTAQRLIDVAGDNIANANTDGYAAKRANVVALPGPVAGPAEVGLGSTVESVERLRDRLVEAALLQHVQSDQRLSTEVNNLATLESFFTEPTGGGIDALLGGFFDSVDALSASPDDPVLREQVVQKAQAVCDAFNRLDTDFTTVAQNLTNSISTTVQNINSLTEQIAYFNGRIRVANASGASAPSLEDQRDQLVSQLAQLTNITVRQDQYGVVNISTSGTLIVDGQNSLPLTVTEKDGTLTVAPAVTPDFAIDVREGQLGALMNLSQDLVPRYRDALDELAGDFRRSVNLVHTTGVGLDGRFTSLQGLNVLNYDEPLSETGWGVPAGTDERLVINVADSATGDVRQYELTLDTTQTAADFLTGLRDAINSDVDHVTASADGGRISLRADDGYSFDFATPYDPNPAEPGDITAAGPASPAILDDYTGDSDLTYTFTFAGDGTVGADPLDVQIEVSDSSGTVLRTLTRQVDANYLPGGAIALENGLKFSLSAGSVAAGDSFSFTAHASMDTAGVLDALGLNCFLTGQGAGAIQVADRILQDNANLAGSLRPMAGDNHNLLALAGVRDGNVAASGTATLNGSYRDLVTELATTRNTKSAQYDNEELLVKDLQNRRDAVSGVSLDEEMVGLVSARTLYQGALKYISAVSGMMQDLVDMI